MELAQLHDVRRQSFFSNLDVAAYAAARDSLEQTLVANDRTEEDLAAFGGVVLRPDFVRLPVPFALCCQHRRWGSLCVCVTLAVGLALVVAGAPGSTAQSMGSSGDCVSRNTQS